MAWQTSSIFRKRDRAEGLVVSRRQRQGKTQPSINTSPILCRVLGKQLPQRDFYLGRTITFGLYSFKIGKRRREQACAFVVGAKSRPARKPPAATAFVPWKTLNFIARDVWEQLVNKVLRVLIQSILMELIRRHCRPNCVPSLPRSAPVPEPLARGGRGEGEHRRKPPPVALLLSPFISATAENKYL